MSRAIVMIAGAISVLVLAQNGLFGVALIIGVVLVSLMRQARRAVNGHAHAGPVSLSARHEAGHMAGADYVDGRVLSARLYPDGSGRVRARIPDDPQAEVTFLLAGAAAAGTDEGAEFDFAAVEEVLADVPACERNGILRRSRRDAERIASSYADEIERNAALLQKHGRL